MPDDAEPAANTEPASPACPWCSVPLPAADAAACPGCGARLLEDEGIEIPGVTAIDPGLLAAAAAPRKVKRTFGSLLVGEDHEVLPPSEAELPAIAPPDADVRREMLRLELDARLAALQAEVKAIAAEDRAAAGPTPPGPTAAGPEGGAEG